MTAKQLPFLDQKTSSLARRYETTPPLPTTTLTRLSFVSSVLHSSFPSPSAKETLDAPSSMVPNGSCQLSLKLIGSRIQYPKSYPTSLTTKFSHKLMMGFPRSSSLFSMMSCRWKKKKRSEARCVCEQRHLRCAFHRHVGGVAWSRQSNMWSMYQRVRCLVNIPGSEQVTEVPEHSACK